MLILDDKPHVDQRLAVIEDLMHGLICAANVCTSTSKTNGSGY